MYRSLRQARGQGGRLFAFLAGRRARRAGGRNERASRRGTDAAHVQQLFNSCTALETLDLCGFKPDSLANLTYTFGGCSKSRTILVDTSWKLPTSGLSAFGTFRNCTSIVGGAGTAYDVKKASGAMMRIDAAGAPGYLTAG